MRKNLEDGKGENKMIYEFGFKNFRSYKSETNIDFTAKPISEFKESLIYGDEKTSLLPVCAIYGPNGGGKSGVLLAFLTLRNIVINPLIQMAFMKSKNEKLSQASIDELKAGCMTDKIEVNYYKWDEESCNLPVEFSVLFKEDKMKYRYELSVFQDVIQQENLFIENLESKEVKSIFERDTKEIYLSEELENIDIENMNEGLPLISFISMFKNINVIDNVIRFFMSVQIVNFDMPSQDRKIWVKAIEEDKKRVLGILMSMGIDICDLIVEYDSEGKVKEVYTRHKFEDGSTKDLKFGEESSGTRKIFSILPVILNAIDKGRLLIIDELDAKLHPVLLQRIIELFTNRGINKNGAQLLFTSHDLITMSNKVLRRDEIWFSAINGYNESVLYSLVDFRKENGDKPRNDENYNKQYLEGRYGADPYMRCILSWEEIGCL